MDLYSEWMAPCDIYLHRFKWLGKVTGYNGQIEWTVCEEVEDGENVITLVSGVTTDWVTAKQFIWDEIQARIDRMWAETNYD